MGEPTKAEIAADWLEMPSRQFYTRHPNIDEKDLARKLNAVFAWALNNLRKIDHAMYSTTINLQCDVIAAALNAISAQPQQPEEAAI